MNKMIAGSALVAVAAIAMTASAYAAQPPVVVNCAKGQKIADALASHPSSAGGLTLLVNGTCTEDVAISRFSGTTIQGNPAATLRPVHTTDTTITANSRLILSDVTIAGGATGLFVGPHSFATVEHSKITGPGVGILVWDNSALDFLDSTVSTTGAYGIHLELGGTALIQADDGDSAEVTGAQTGVFCNFSKLQLVTVGSGKLTIDKNKRLGIQGLDCGLHTFNPAGAISIAANGPVNGYGAGLEQNGGWADLTNVKISGTRGFAAINASLNAGTRLDLVTITDNVAGISTNQGAIVQFGSFNGPSTVKNNGTNVFECYQGGQIYVDQIAGEITPAPSKAQLGCLHIGGP